MHISSELLDSEIDLLLKSFYEYFENGYIFEDFLKEYLLKMGLDEVMITQRSRDGGYDLTAIRKGVGDFSDKDLTNYYIQAKRYKPGNTVGVKAIRELKGTIPFGHKGIFITTSSFTSDAIITASDEPSKIVVLVDGKKLILSCIDNEIGFTFKPVFSKNEMNKFIKYKSEVESIVSEEFTSEKVELLEKMITANDIRARIISIPSYIMRQINADATSIDVLVNNTDNFHFNIVRGRNYFGGVTQFHKKYKLLTDDGVANPKNSKWYYDNVNKIIKIFIY